MKHLLHHYSWLVYRFWPFLLCYALLWAGVDLAVWLSSKWLNSDDVAYSVHLWLPLGGAMVLSRALMADPVPGTVAFWRTRPPRWRSLWGSQFLFLLTVSSPPVLCWLANGWMMDNTPDQWLASLADVTLILCPLLAVATVCSFARNWYFFSIGVVAFAVCWLGGFWSLSSFGDRRWLVSNTGYAVLPRIAGLLIIVPAAACIPV